jgi:ribonuclease T2
MELQWLADAGIIPSKDRTYKRDDIEATLQASRGNVSVVLGCEQSELREVWYFFNIRGPLSRADFRPSEPDFSGTGGKAGKSCPPTVKYLPKS